MNIRILLLLILAGIIIGFIHASYTIEKEEHPEQTFNDCTNRVSIPIIGIQRFAFCPADSTVWTGEAWEEPTPFEWRRIQRFYGEE